MPSSPPKQLEELTVTVTWPYPLGQLKMLAPECIKEDRTAFYPRLRFLSVVSLNVSCFFFACVTTRHQFVAFRLRLVELQRPPPPLVRALQFSFHPPALLPCTPSMGGFGAMGTEAKERKKGCVGKVACVWDQRLYIETPGYLRSEIVTMRALKTKHGLRKGERI